MITTMPKGRKERPNSLTTSTGGRTSAGCCMRFQNVNVIRGMPAGCSKVLGIPMLGCSLVHPPSGPGLSVDNLERRSTGSMPSMNSLGLVQLKRRSRFQRSILMTGWISLEFLAQWIVGSACKVAYHGQFTVYSLSMQQLRHRAFSLSKWARKWKFESPISGACILFGLSNHGRQSVVISRELMLATFCIDLESSTYVLRSV